MPYKSYFIKKYYKNNKVIKLLAKCFSIWRRDWDSNPGGACAPNGFQDRRFRPLSHLSPFQAGLLYKI